MMPDVGWIEERERLAAKLPEGPWSDDSGASFDGYLQIGGRGYFVDLNAPGEALGTWVSRDADEDQAWAIAEFLANARNEEPRVLAILRAAAALVADFDEEPTEYNESADCEQAVFCGRFSWLGEPHAPDCRWQALVAAFEARP